MNPQGFPPIEDITPLPLSPAEQAQPWAFWISASLLGLVLLWLLVLSIRALARRLECPSLPPAPGKQALRALKALRKQAAGLSGGQFTAQLGAVLRTFLHRRFGIMANFQSTSEILHPVAGNAGLPPAPPAALPVAELLARCDMLKFSGGAADDPAARNALLDAAESALNEASAARSAAVSVSVSAPLPLSA